METYDPVPEVLTQGWGLLQPGVHPEPGMALVVYRPGRVLRPLFPPADRLTFGERVWGGIKQIYKVNISQHSLEWTSQLPSSGDGFHFSAELQVLCSVQDPVVVVGKKLRDARAALEPILVEIMRAQTRKFGLEESALAEAAVSEALRTSTWTEIAKTGFALERLVVRLALDEHARTHVQRIQRISWQDEYSKRCLPLIERGQWALLGVRLAEAPEALPEIIDTVRRQHSEDLDRQLQALKVVIEGDGLEGFQLEDAGKRLLVRMIDGLGLTKDAKAIPQPERGDLLPPPEPKSG
jgi:hypothetical protein